MNTSTEALSAGRAGVIPYHTSGRTCVVTIDNQAPRGGSTFMDAIVSSKGPTIVRDMIYTLDMYPFNQQYYIEDGYPIVQRAGNNARGAPYFEITVPQRHLLPDTNVPVRIIFRICEDTQPFAVPETVHAIRVNRYIVSNVHRGMPMKIELTINSDGSDDESLDEPEVSVCTGRQLTPGEILPPCCIGPHSLSMWMQDEAGNYHMYSITPPHLGSP